MKFNIRFLNLLASKTEYIIIAALELELTYILNQAKINKEYSHFGFKIFECEVSGKRIILGLSGIGKLNGALITQYLITTYKTNHVYNIGVAGGISSSVSIGDVVIGKKIYQSDFDLSILGYKPGEMPNKKYSISTCFDKKDNRHNLKDKNIKIHIGNIVSADQFVNDEKTILELEKMYSALAKDMESFAVAYVCDMYGMKFDIIRGLSDMSGKKAKHEFEANLQAAANNASKVLLEIISV